MYSLMTFCIIVTSFLLYFEVMIPRSFDREGQSEAQEYWKNGMLEKWKN
jgi:hypothetical protein